MKSFIQICLLAFTAATIAQAGSLVLTWDNADQTASAGDTVQFIGTLTNNSDETVFLNNGLVNFDDVSGLSFTNLFLANAVYSLDPGQSQYDVELFDVVVTDPFTDPFTKYSGTFLVLGGLDGGALDELTAPDFSLTIQAAETGSDAPEPASFITLGAGLLALGLKARRHCFACQ